MDFIKHYELKDQHALFSPSQYYWLSYDNNKLADYYVKLKAKERGTELHEFAATCIRLGQKLPKSKKTLNMYVNDAIGFKMTPEQPLFYSKNCFGTADSIAFDDNFLRIHDYKSGTIPAHMGQLLIYAGLFCLEYNVRPSDITSELRIYQNDEIIICNPTFEELSSVCNKIINADKIASKLIMKGM